MGAYQAVEGSYDIQYKRSGLEKTAGSGVFGDVRACTHLGTHELRAVKSIQKTSWNTRSTVLEEIKVLRAVSGRHPNIIEFIEYFEEWGVMNLIFEYCTKGSLDEAIKSKRSPTSEGGAAQLLVQLVRALLFLQEQRIVHRDVKPANLLLADEAVLKLADFGTACFYTEPIKHVEGTPAFFAPEEHQLPRGKGYSYPVDMWALGISMYMLCFGGTHPFEDRGAVSKQLVYRGDFDVGWLTSGKAADLLRWLLMPCPDQRIRVEEVPKHPWFASHKMGDGTFSRTRPPHKLTLDSHGNWQKMQW